VLYNGTVVVKLNDRIGPYFQSYKGVRQGDPLSPILFNFLANSLTRMIIKSQQANLVTDLVPNLIPLGVVVLQYADDTIICPENDVMKAGAKPHCGLWCHRTPMVFCQSLIPLVFSPWMTPPILTL
jgi:hypothetical protein